MEDRVKTDILNVLKNSLEAIRKEDITELKNMSDHVIHDASVYQDEYSISIAVIIYGIAKIFERVRYREYKDWNKFYRAIFENLTKAYNTLKKGDIDDYEYNIHKIIQDLNKLDVRFKKNISEVIERAKISKASRLYEHGISTGRTAELLGISEWELMEYVGGTGISDVRFNISKPINQRIKLIRSLFK